jgi:hypothetical protein
LKPSGLVFVAGVSGYDLEFGASLAISGDTLAIGAPGPIALSTVTAREESRGSVYVFKQTGGVWTQAQSVMASDSRISQRMGLPVAIDGETIGAETLRDDQAYVFCPCEPNIVPPAITTSVVALQQGKAIAQANIAAVSDDQDDASTLTVKTIDGGAATGISITNIKNAGGAIRADVAASCAATSGTVRLRARDSGGNAANAMLEVTVTPSDPPTIKCPSQVIATTSTTGSAPRAVSFSAPVAAGDCPVSVACNPPSGSAFPAGVTTVTCTAKDAGGNQAQCSFTVTVFDVCLQDDAYSSRSLMWNSQTGDYIFCCAGTIITGRGAATRTGNTFKLIHNSSVRRLSAQADAGSLRGAASLQMLTGGGSCSITDRDIRNSSCACAQ